MTRSARLQRHSPRSQLPSRVLEKRRTGDRTREVGGQAGPMRSREGWPRHGRAGQAAGRSWPRPAGAPRGRRAPSHRGAPLPGSPAPVAEPSTRLGPGYLGLVIIGGVRHDCEAREHGGRERKECSAPASRDRKSSPRPGPPGNRKSCRDRRHVQAAMLGRAKTTNASTFLSSPNGGLTRKVALKSLREFGSKDIK